MAQPSFKPGDIIVSPDGTWTNLVLARMPASEAKCVHAEVLDEEKGYLVYGFVEKELLWLADSIVHGPESFYGYQLVGGPGHG